MRSEESVWKALASPTRRMILDLLRSGPKTTGDLVGEFTDLSRYAVMQHLEVLEQGNLLLVRREGRHRYNYLNAIPIQEVYERWVDRFSGIAASRSLLLKRYVEREETQMAESIRTVRIESEMRLRAPAEVVFRAATTEQQAWYPHNYGGERMKKIVFEEKVGGNLYEDWGGGLGILYGTVTYFDPPKAYCTRGHLKGGVLLEQWMQLEEEGDETIVRASTLCFGEISDEAEEGIRFHGDISKYEKALRNYVEKGVKIGS